MAFRIATLILFVGLFSHPGIAQTSDELRHKYKVSSAVEGYEVRPGIIATAFFAENGQIVSISTKSRNFYAEDQSSRYAVSLTVAHEILAELAPIEKRGKLCNVLDAEYGANWSLTTLYENVQINMLVHGRATPNETVSELGVLWRKVSCPLAPSNNSLDRSGRFVLSSLIGLAGG